jgi:hypothetical protein
MSKTKQKDRFTVPGFIELEGNRWCLPEQLTVAQWREAQQNALWYDDKQTLRLFRWATVLLAQAEEHGAPEDVCLLPWLDEHVTPPSESTTFTRSNAIGGAVSGRASASEYTGSGTKLQKSQNPIYIATCCLS